MTSRLRPLTLRSKLIGSLLVAIVAVSALIGVVTLALLSTFLTAQLDRQVQSTTVRLGGPSGSGPGLVMPGARALPHIPAAQWCSAEGSGPAASQPDESVFAVISGPAAARSVTAAIRGEFPTCAPLSAAESQPLTGVAVNGPVAQLTLGEFGTYRVIARSVGDDVVVSGLSTRSIDTIQQRLLITLLCVAGGATLLGAAVVWRIVRASLRPLDDMAAKAREVARLPLHEGEVNLSTRMPPGLVDDRTEVGQVGAAFDQMLSHVGLALTARQRSESRVRAFVADASHELRTPLTAIRGYAELARRNPDDLAAVRHALGRVEAESVRMSALVDDLLLLARLDAGRPLDHEVVNLSQVIIDTVSDAHVAGPDHAWQLQLPDQPVTVTGDGQRLHQVLTNLLANACNHTPAGTEITVTLAVDLAGTQIRVTDNGPGIDPALQPDIFERFVRGERSRSRTAGSTGLGLAIAAAIINAHGGTISLDSKPGRTQFTISIPRVDTGESR